MAESCSYKNLAYDGSHASSIASVKDYAERIEILPLLHASSATSIASDEVQEVLEGVDSSEADVTVVDMEHDEESVSEVDEESEQPLVYLSGGHGTVTGTAVQLANGTDISLQIEEVNKSLSVGYYIILYWDFCVLSVIEVIPGFHPIYIALAFFLFMMAPIVQAGLMFLSVVAFLEVMVDIGRRSASEVVWDCWKAVCVCTELAYDSVRSRLPRFNRLNLPTESSESPGITSTSQGPTVAIEMGGVPTITDESAS